MQKQAGVALGAGLASALLFVVSAKGTTAGALITYFTALPIMVAALAFGHVSGLAGALIGAGAIAVGLGPLLGVFFALCFALPGWWLAYLGLLARPAPATGPVISPVPIATDRAPALLWYPVGRLVTWAAVIAIGAVLLIGAVVLVRYGGFDAATGALARRLDEVFGDSASKPGAAMFFVRVLPLAMAASLFLMLSVNLWLAGRVANLSQRLRRPWPDVPEGLRLPKSAGLALLVAIGPALTGGAIGTAAGVVAAALALAFALQGLATAHVLTRGFAGRRAILSLIYIITVIVPVAIVALSLIGLIDCLFSLRNRRPPSPTPVI